MLVGVFHKTAIGTANFLLFFDKLFDTFNGSAVAPVHGKEFRVALTSTSPHFKFWREAIPVLETVRFLSANGREHIPPTIKNWLATIRGRMIVWQKLKAVGFKFLASRNLNQDPAEKFFGDIRSHPVRNVNPTCEAFLSSYKSLVVNNFVSAHSPDANCENDGCSALDNLRSFLRIMPTDGILPLLTVPLNDGFVFQTTCPDQVLQSRMYIAGYVACTLLKLVKCKVCREQLTSNTSQHCQLIEAREYKSNLLLKPGTEFAVLFNKSCDVLHHFLPSICAERNLKSKLKVKLRKLVENHFTCSSHELFEIFINQFIRFYIFTWVNNCKPYFKRRQNPECQRRH